MVVHNERLGWWMKQSMECAVSCVGLSDDISCDASEWLGHFLPRVSVLSFLRAEKARVYANPFLNQTSVRPPFALMHAQFTTSVSGSYLGMYYLILVADDTLWSSN